MGNLQNVGSPFYTQSGEKEHLASGMGITPISRKCSQNFVASHQFRELLQEKVVNGVGRVAPRMAFPLQEFGVFHPAFHAKSPKPIFGHVTRALFFEIGVVPRLVNVPCEKKKPRSSRLKRKQAPFGVPQSGGLRDGVLDVSNRVTRITDC